MERFEIGAGRSIEEAVNDALSKLGTDEYDNIEVLETPSKGFLGIGATLARVKVSIEVSGAEKKVERAEKRADKPEKIERPERTEKLFREEKKIFTPKESGKAEDFLSGVFEKMRIDAVIESKSDEEGNLKIVVSGESTGLVIGKRGETLDALQYLTSLVLNRGTEEYTRVSLDSENYREKRTLTLQRLAKRLATTVSKTGKDITLEPMNPSERRVIHATLQKYRDVSTHSIGVEPNRRLVISYGGTKKEGDGLRKRPCRQGRGARREEDFETRED